MKHKRAWNARTSARGTWVEAAEATTAIFIIMLCLLLTVHRQLSTDAGAIGIQYSEVMMMAVTAAEA